MPDLLCGRAIRLSLAGCLVLLATGCGDSADPLEGTAPVGQNVRRGCETLLAIPERELRSVPMTESMRQQIGDLTGVIVLGLDGEEEQFAFELVRELVFAVTRTDAKHASEGLLTARSICESVLEQSS